MKVIREGSEESGKGGGIAGLWKGGVNPRWARRGIQPSVRGKEGSLRRREKTTRGSEPTRVNGEGPGKPRAEAGGYWLLQSCL